MYFDKLINKILYEDGTIIKPGSIPILDGKREVYVLQYSEYIEDVYQFICKRVDDSFIKTWDYMVARTDMYRVTLNAEQAIPFFKMCIYNRDAVPLVDEAIRRFYTDVTGKPVIGTYVSAFDYKGNISLGLEVDLNAYSGVHKAIEDDISNF